MADNRHEVDRLDTNKGDQQRPKYRSRLVAKEFNTGAAEGLFAATPPLEALRLLLSDAATTTAESQQPVAAACHQEKQKQQQGERKVVVVNDIARAFFEAPAKRSLR